MKTQKYHLTLGGELIHTANAKSISRLEKYSLDSSENVIRKDSFPVVSFGVVSQPDCKEEVTARKLSAKLDGALFIGKTAEFTVSGMDVRLMVRFLTFHLSVVGKFKVTLYEASNTVTVKRIK